MFARLFALLLAGALLAACQTPYADQTQTILNLIGGGLTDTEVFTPPYTSYTRNDGAYCEAYQIRQFNRIGQVRYGEATVCQYPNGPWSLVSRSFGPWSPANAPVPSPSYPVPNPSYPSQPGQPGAGPVNPPMPPAPAPGQPGQWVPVVK